MIGRLFVGLLLFTVMPYVVSAERMPKECPARDKPHEVMSKPCPYNCNLAGYSHWGCREWKKGSTCYIGPVKKAKGHVSKEKSEKPVEPKK